jgi:hypothetical protein
VRLVDHQALAGTVWWVADLGHPCQMCWWC